MSVSNLISDVRTGAAVSTATAGTGLSTILEWIPNDIGKLASVVGIVLSLVLIYTHTRKGRLEREKIELDIELLKTKLNDERQV